MASEVFGRLNLIDKQGKFRKPTRKSALKKVRSALPILGWAVPYDWRENLAGDVTAGVTLAVMQVLSGTNHFISGNRSLFQVNLARSIISHFKSL